MLSVRIEKRKTGGKPIFKASLLRKHAKPSQEEDRQSHLENETHKTGLKMMEAVMVCPGSFV